MFTGLIQYLGTVSALSSGGGPVELTVRPDSPLPGDLELGESIAVSGTCLTLTKVGTSAMTFDVGAESVERTTLGGFGPGRRVNMERALRPMDRLGGHLVLGHVDGVARVLERRMEKGVLQVVCGLPESIAPLVCEKGSIAVDGVSLTVNEARRDAFRVTLIPETMARTTLVDLGVGDLVNLEADILARHIARLLAFSKGGGGDESSLDLEFLSRYGYL